MTKAAAISSLEQLTHEQGFVYSLSFMLHKNLFFDPSQVESIDWRARLSVQELAFMAGLMVKAEIDPDTIPPSEVVAAQIERSEDHLRQLHEAHMAPAMDRLVELSASREKPIDDAAFKSILAGEFTAEPMFYEASGAYDFQFWELSHRKYDRDAAWLMDRKSIIIAAAVEICRRLKSLAEEKKRAIDPDVLSFVDLCRAVLDLFSFSRDDLNMFAAADVDSFLRNFTLVPGSANTPLDSTGGYNELDGSPIILLGEDRYFLPIVFNLAQAIYDTPFYWMGTDEGYFQEAARHRGDYAEDVAKEYLERVFGPTNVWRGVKVYQGKRALTDIDVLAIAGNRAVILQAKSKRLTELAKRGDEERQRSDFGKAVQSAYDQGLVSRRAIQEATNRLVDSSGTDIRLSELVKDAYIICVTTDHYPALAHQVRTYLRKQTDDPMPLALSLFDLDLLTTYLADPFEFLYYVRQRVVTSEHFVAMSELALLGFHLEQKLYPDERMDFAGLDDSLAAVFDADFPVRRGFLNRPDHVPLRPMWPGPRAEALVRRLKGTGDPGLTDAIFAIYDLATVSAEEFLESVDQVRAKVRRDGKVHTAAIEIGEDRSGMCYLCAADRGELTGKLGLAPKRRTPGL